MDIAGRLCGDQYNKLFLPRHFLEDYSISDFNLKITEHLKPEESVEYFVKILRYFTTLRPKAAILFSHWPAATSQI